MVVRFFSAPLCILPINYVSCPLDILFIDYNSTEHVTWKSPGPMCGWVGKLPQGRRAGSSARGRRSTERSVLFHSWYTDPSVQSKGEQCTITRKSAITDWAEDENHVIDWDKAKVVDGDAQRQTKWIKEALWIDPDMHQSGSRILSTQPHMGQGDFHVTCSIKL